MTTSYANFKPRQRPVNSARHPNPQSERMEAYRQHGEATVAEPFRGITTDGSLVPSLFQLQQTGLPIDSIATAGRRFLARLSPEQRAAASFPLESDAWRRWSNIHVFVMRHGLLLEDLDEAGRGAALGLLRETLSDSGFETARNIMRLNETIGEITGRWEEYGEWPYWLSIMGEPAAGAPWGWQIDGHHLIVNCAVIGDQLVTTPMFMGSEPVRAEGGRHAGTAVFESEESRGLALMQSMSADDQRRAVLSPDLPRDVLTSAFRDNFELRYEGVCYRDLPSDAQARLLSLIEIYLGRTRADQARLKLAEIREHLDSTYFAWMGSWANESIFYYRVHSPVVLIEFDHQAGVAFDNDVPSRNHIHTVVRTPNGNDYGIDLLRQHYAQHEHPTA